MSTGQRIGGLKPRTFWSMTAAALLLIVIVAVATPSSEWSLGESDTKTAKAKKRVYDIPAVFVNACEREAATYGTGALSTKAKRLRACEKWSAMFPIVELKGKSRDKSDVEWAKNAGIDGGICLAVKLTPGTVRLDEGTEDYAFYADFCDSVYTSSREVFPNEYRALFGT